MAAEIHKLKKNGKTIYPATTTDAVVDPIKKVAIADVVGFKDFLVCSELLEWNGNSNQLLYIPYMYRNTESYGSGFRIEVIDVSTGTKSSIGSWSNKSESMNGVMQYQFNLLEDYGILNLTLDWSKVPEGFNRSLKYPIYIPMNMDIHIQDLGYLGNRLPMIKKGSNLKILPGTTDTFLTPIQFGDFLIDLKFEGNPEEGYQYGINWIQHEHAPEATYNNYISAYKYKDGKYTQIGNYSAKIVEDGINIQSLTLNSDKGSITAIKVAINWKGLTSFKGAAAYTLSIENGYIYDQDYIFDSSVGYIAEKEQKGQMVAAIKSLEDSIELITSNEYKIAWLLEGDLDYFLQYNKGYNAQKYAGQYTKKAITSYTFNNVVIGPIKTSSDATVNYAIFKTEAGRSVGRRECPLGVPTNKSTKLKEGTISITTEFMQYDIAVDSTTVLEGEQIVAYFWADKNITILGSNTMTGLDNPPEDSNVCLFLTGTQSDPLNTSWFQGNPTYGYFSVALILKLGNTLATKEYVDKKLSSELSTELNKQVPPLVEELTKSSLQITMPDTIYAVVDKELNLWNDAVSLPMDKGLYSPMNYKCEWYSTVGLVTERCFRFTPKSNQAGNTYKCTCKLYDLNFNLIVEKEFNIEVLAATGLTSSKNVVYFGDSLNASGQVSNKLHDNFEAIGGTIPKFLGTNGTVEGDKYESGGGYGFSDYATAGRAAYRVPVTEISSLSVNAIYKDTANNQYVVAEVNISDGNGNILLRKNTGTSADLVMPDGTLTKVSGSGDETITYTGAFKVAANPLWNNETNSLDLSQYKTRVGLSTGDKINLVSFQFFVNDASLADDTKTLDKYIKDLYDLFIGDNPNCIMLVGLGAMSGNTANGAGANYGSSWDIHRYIDRVYRLRLYLLSKYQNSPEFPNLHIACSAPQMDRYYGYGFGSRAISQRDQEKESYHVNYVHPVDIGYGQMADAYFGIYLKYLK